MRKSSTTWACCHASSSAFPSIVIGCSVQRHSTSADCVAGVDEAGVVVAAVGGGGGAGCRAVWLHETAATSRAAQPATAVAVRQRTGDQGRGEGGRIGIRNV